MIQLGLAGLGSSALTGALFFGPGWARVSRLADSEGIESTAVRARVRRLLLVSRLDLGLLLGIVFVMTIKPSADEQAALAVSAIAAAFAVLGLALFQAEVRKETARSNRSRGALAAAGDVGVRRPESAVRSPPSGVRHRHRSVTGNP